ncbi:MAG: DUF2974 domain-containing protein [Ruminococcaceae bacterium]|nr:DUF2974 domain-containing protein [Oscillospiraceae bacterium]
MDNMLDYIKWRGDLGFSAAPFTEVDNLIFSDFSYLDFTGIVPESFDKSVTLNEAVKTCGNRCDEEVSLGVLVPDDITKMAHMMAESRRFGSVKLSGYVNRINEETGLQFSALTCTLEDGTVCVVYRGTDDTLVGWKESFALSYSKVIPSHGEALEYMKKAALSTSLPLRVMGHSKGGNLAVFASAFSSAETQARIIGIYNNDGPGFNGDIRQTEGYRRIKGKLHTLVPQSSVVGMLLEHEEDYTVVKSKNHTGIMSHNGFSWELDGPSFYHLDDISAGGHLVDDTLKHWFSEMDDRQREKFVDALFSVLEVTGAKTLTELNQPKNAGAIMKAVQNMDQETKEIISKTFSLLFQASKKSIAGRTGKRSLFRNM